MVNSVGHGTLEAQLAPIVSGRIDGIAPLRDGTLKLDDGRALGYAEYGASDGYPVIYCHGFPGSRFEAALAQRAARALGARVIAFDRPGYGRSDINSHHSIASWAADVAAAADRLGLARFAVLGVSGGCPYALACTHLLAQRVSATGVVCGLGPLAESEMRRALVGLARAVAFFGFHTPRLFAPVYGRFLAFAARRQPQYILEMLTLSSSEADRRLMQDAEVSGAIITSIREALRGGAAPVILDMRNYAQPWGFHPHEIGARVHLWHGEADTTVPVSIGRYLAARLPNCEARFLPGEGHFSLPVNHVEEILRPLVAPAMN
jgi:pimeloyl-ACP methyl ester carboxylesterase